MQSQFVAYGDIIGNGLNVGDDFGFKKGAWLLEIRDERKHTKWRRAV